MGLKTGAIFSIFSLLSAFTIAIPMFSVFPSIYLHQAISYIFPKLSFVYVEIATFFILTVLFVLVIVFTFIKVRKCANEYRRLKLWEVLVMMLVFYVIVHNLGYYIVLAISNFPIDALNSIMAVVSFPFSGLFFVLLGFLMDWYWKKWQKK